MSPALIAYVAVIVSGGAALLAFSLPEFLHLGIVAIAAVVVLASSRRTVRLIAGAFVLVGLVAAVMAPIVMTGDSDRMEPAPTMSR